MPNILLSDESLEMEVDKETNQVLLKGLGELHIDIVLSKLKSEYDLKINLGKMFVAYKESVNGSVQHTQKIDRLHNQKLRFFEIEIEIESKVTDEEQVEDSERGARRTEVVIDLWIPGSKAAKSFETFCELKDNINLQKSKGGVFDNPVGKKVVNENYTFCNEVVDSLYDIKFNISASICVLSKHNYFISFILRNRKIH